MANNVYTINSRIPVPKLNLGAAGSGLNLAGSGAVLTSNGSSANWSTQSLTTQSIQELMEMNIPDSEFVKKYEVLESEEDFLALSVAWHRLRRERQSGRIQFISISNLIDRELFKQVSEEDRIRANTIRDFYQKRFLMLSLKSKRLTMFRKDLCDYVNGNSKVVPEKMLPMIYRLPEFYDYDVDFDDMKREFKTEIPDHKGKLVTKQQVTLYPLKCLTKNTKRMKCHEYWMHDSNNNLCVMVLDLKNQLQPLWDREFSKKSITIEGYLMPKMRDDIDYYQLGNWNVL